MTTVAITEKRAAIVPKRFTVEEFRKMTEVGILPEESGWEIIDGYLIDKMSIGSNHAGTVNLLTQKLIIMVAGKAAVAVQNPIRIDDYNAPEPDISLLRPREDFYRKSLPAPQDALLLIEVSDSTVEYDRDIKKTLYAEAGIAEFWLINLKENTVERYSSPKNGSYRLAEILESGETIKAGTIENLELKIDEILGS